MIAAPFGAALLGDFGAEVIKVEIPVKGDALRHVAPMFADRSLYWSVLGRNKCSITLDLHAPRGRELLLELVKRSDAVLENFRPGTLERWELGYDVLQAANPDIVLVRVSGYGQDGPYRDKAGFGTPAAAIGGLTYITGYPDRPPVSVPIALADYLAACSKRSCPPMARIDASASAWAIGPANHHRSASTRRPTGTSWCSASRPTASGTA